MKHLVILSGGQDSTTCLALALERKRWSPSDEVEALSFDYGQRHRLELDSAANIARHFGVAHRTLAIPNLLGGNSPLNSSSTLETYTDYKSMEKIIGDRVERTFVPGRNMLFLTIAACVAAAEGFGALWLGVCEEDNANYPDCRGAFVEAMGQAINAALEGYTKLSIRTPLLRVPKDESIQLMHDLGGHAWRALALTHTCYHGTFPPCGACHSCVLRAEAFARAGLADPLIERARRGNALP
jgi:7-cyano-7-deazaguanine synthase